MSDIKGVDTRDIIQTLRHEMLKTHKVYESVASFRLLEVYEARTNAKHGDTCLRTRIQYDGTTNRELGRKEELTAWDSSWDF